MNSRAFCEHAAAWLDADPAHVVALHCKVGTSVCVTPW